MALALLAAVWLVRRAVVHDATYALWIAAGTLLTVWGLHQRRPDHHFLRVHVPRAHAAMAIEYAALVLPVFLGLLLAQAWPATGLLLLVLVFPWLAVARASGVRGAWLRVRIPTRLFEWKSLLQSTHPWSLLLWLAAMAFCWLPILPLFLLGAVALMAAGAQEQCEPRAMLLATSVDARAFLRTKIVGAMGLMCLVEIPVLIGATLFQPGWWWIHAMFGCGMAVLVGYAVALKYANYRPNERLEANGANVAVATVFAILPGLTVVPLIMLLNEMRNAHANLNTYFDAHHH